MAQDKRIFNLTNKCLYCGVDLTEENRTVDHVVPKSKGGTNKISNLVPCCKACNNSKRDYTLKDWCDWHNKPYTTIYGKVKAFLNNRTLKIA